MCQGEGFLAGVGNRAAGWDQNRHLSTVRHHVLLLNAEAVLTLSVFPILVGSSLKWE